jgi:hypothetical protein
MTPVAMEGTTYSSDYEGVAEGFGRVGRKPLSRPVYVGGAVQGESLLPKHAIAALGATGTYVLHLEEAALADWWPVWRRVQKHWLQLIESSTGTLCVAEHDLLPQELDLDRLLAGWVEHTAQLGLLDETRPMEISWISLAGRQPGRPLPGPASLTDLPRAKPTVRFQFLVEDD